MYNLTLRQLKTIVTVSETKRLVRAAEILSLTPPAVTIQLKLAEDQIGLILFDRTPDGLNLTDAGNEVVKSAHKIFGQLSDLTNRLESVTLAKRGTVKIGIVSSAKYFAYKIIAEFLKLNIDIKVIVKVASRETILKKIESYEIDLAITGTIPIGYDLETKSFGNHPIILIASPSSHLIEQNIEKQELTKEHFITRESGSGTFNTLQSFLEELKMEYEPILTEMGTNETIKQAVMSGLGIAMISEHCCSNELKFGLLKRINIKGLPIIKKWYVAKLKYRLLSPASKLMFSYIEEKGGMFLPK